MFDTWLRSDPNASWEVLIDALHKMKYRCLAQSVEQTYANVCKTQNAQGKPKYTRRRTSTTDNFCLLLLDNLVLTAYLSALYMLTH